MPQVNVSFKQIVMLINQLTIEQKFQIVKSIAQKENYRNKIYVYAAQLAKEKGFDKMTESELEDLLHEK